MYNVYDILTFNSAFRESTYYDDLTGMHIFGQLLLYGTQNQQKKRKLIKVVTKCC